MSDKKLSNFVFAFGYSRGYKLHYVAITQADHWAEYHHLDDSSKADNLVRPLGIHRELENIYSYGGKDNKSAARAALVKEGATEDPGLKAFIKETDL